jgi:CRP-like cAMP-binding protein
MSVNYANELLLFNGLTPAQLGQLLPLLSSQFECAGSVLFEQGDQAEFLYLVVEGEVSVRYKPEDGPQISVARVRPQGIVGWSAALGNPVYTSSAICSTDCQLM